MFAKNFVRSFVVMFAVSGATFLPGSVQAQHVLGVTLKDYHGRGAMVIGTRSGSASQRMICPDCNQNHQITPGVNVITAVNGQSVGDTDEAVRAISSSPLLAEITILNVQRGTEKTYQTRLESAHGNMTAKRSGRSKQRGVGSGSGAPNIDLNQSGLGGDSNDIGGSHSPGLDDWRMHNWTNQLYKNRGWSTRPDLGPVTW
jgi:hypothetical protein